MGKSTTSAPFIALNYSGELVSTTNIQQAELLGQQVTVRDIVGSQPAYYESVDNGHLLIWTATDLHELA